MAGSTDITFEQWADVTPRYLKMARNAMDAFDDPGGQGRSTGTTAPSTRTATAGSKPNTTSATAPRRGGRRKKAAQASGSGTT